MSGGDPRHADDASARRLELTGRVVRPGDADYDAATQGWNRLFAHRPSAIVFAQHAHDVVAAVGWARQNNVAFRVRSGRHSLEGWSSLDDGIVIDVSDLKSVSIDAENGTAIVGAGLNQLEAVTALGAAGYATATGTEGSVGLAGATLGGGFGLLTRVYGMACDNLVAAEVVVASGHVGAELIAVDEESHGDLLWALRGAGNGSFGVVTELTYRVHPLAETVYVTATWQGLDDLLAIFEAWQRSAPYADNRLTSQLEIHRDEIVLLAVLASGSEGEAERMLAPLLSVGAPQVVLTTGGWAETYAAFQIPTDDEPANWMFLSEFVTEPFPDEAIDVIADFMAKAPTAGCNYFTNAFGGAVTGSEPPGGSAFAHRGALFYAEPGAGWGVRDADGSVSLRDRAGWDVRDADEGVSLGAGAGRDVRDADVTAEPLAADALTAEPLTAEPLTLDAVTAACREWVAAFHNALEPYVNGAYVNVPNADAPDWQHDYWGSGVARLQQVKRRYDPGNVFRFEQSITPGAS